MGRTVIIKFTSTGDCMDASGYYVRTRPCDASKEGMRWHVSTGGYIVRHAENRCMDVGPGDPRNWQSLRVISCNGKENQQFRVHDNGQISSERDGRCLIE